jgi:hypothetical protein
MMAQIKTTLDEIKAQWDDTPPDTVAWGWLTPEQFVALQAEVASAFERGYKEAAYRGESAGIALWRDRCGDLQAQVEALRRREDREVKYARERIGYLKQRLLKMAGRRERLDVIGFVPSGHAVSLEQCPVGLFLSDSEVCLKTEYTRADGAVDAYIVSSGEAFWGPQPQTVEHQRTCMVQPLAALAAATAPSVPEGGRRVSDG